MKKLTKRYQHWLLARARAQTLARLKKQHKIDEVSAPYISQSRLSISERIELTKKHGTRRLAPETLCLNENYDEVVAMVTRLRERTLIVYTRGEKSIHVNFSRAKKEFRYHNSYTDFSTIKKITPAAALLLAAEYDRIKRVSRIPLYAIDVEKWNPQVRETMRQLGFLKLLNVKESEVPRAGKIPVTTLPFLSGVKLDSTGAGLRVDELAPLYADDRQESKMFLYDGLVEAMNNVTSHAYPKNYNFKFPPDMGRWWLTGSYDEEQKKLNVIFLDLGITIPVKLPRSKFRKQAANLIRLQFGSNANIHDARYDAEQIRAAMNLHTSSTKTKGRGLGMPQMKDFIDNSRNGRLRILSRCGEYVYTKGGQEDCVNHTSSIGGTLIDWEIYR